MSTALPPQAKIGLSFDLPVFKQKLSDAGRPDLADRIHTDDDVTDTMVAVVLRRHAGVS